MLVHKNTDRHKQQRSDSFNYEWLDDPPAVCPRELLWSRLSQLQSGLPTAKEFSDLVPGLIPVGLFNFLSILVLPDLIEQRLTASEELVHDVPLQLALFDLLSFLALEGTEIFIGQSVCQCVSISPHPRQGCKGVHPPERLRNLNDQDRHWVLR